MGIFGRKSKSGEEAAMDEALPFFTSAEAARLRTLVVEEFARRGVAVTEYPDRVVSEEGATYGLWNLGALCRGVEGSDAEWPAIVAGHVGTLLNPPPAADELSDEELLECIHARAFGTAFLPDGVMNAMAYAHPLADGLVELLALDFPETVITVADENLVGRDISAMWAAGRARTAAVPIDDIQWSGEEGDPRMALVSGESFFVASLALDMPALLARVYGQRDYPHGVVVGLPHRHSVALHPIDSIASLSAVNQVVRFTAFSFRDAAGGISPDAYWWNGHELTRITRQGPDGNPGVVAAGEFGEMLNRLPPA